MQPRSSTYYALTLAALVVGPEPLLVRSLGSNTPAWSHWWCSAASSASGASHVAASAGGLSGASGGLSGASGGLTGASGGLEGALHTTLAVLAVHWPHFLPMLLALGALVYLWRADALHRAAASPKRSSPQKSSPSMAMVGTPTTPCSWAESVDARRASLI
jgi:hypothetical protein